MVSGKSAIPICGFLLHVSHYDSWWCGLKSEEKPFDIDLGLEVVDKMAEVGLNLLVIDCADGVEYESHPELSRHYSVPMGTLEGLVERAQEKSIEVVPKLNFSHSEYERHNYWFRPHNALFDNNEYWRNAFDVIDELIETCKPPRYFHIGMDEDDNRSNSRRLRDGLKERGLRAVMWNDSAHDVKRPARAEKALAAEKEIPKDVVQVVWDYTCVQLGIVQRLVKQGFEVWGAPGRNPGQVSAWRDAILQSGGKGLLMVLWLPCHRSNRSKFFKLIEEIGPLYCANYF